MLEGRLKTLRQQVWVGYPPWKEMQLPWSMRQPLKIELSFAFLLNQKAARVWQRYVGWFFLPEGMNLSSSLTAFDGAALFGMCLERMQEQTRWQAEGRVQ